MKTSRKDGMVTYSHTTGFPSRRVYKSDSLRTARKFAASFGGFIATGKSNYLILI